MKWTKCQIKSLKDNYQLFFEHKEEAEIVFQRKWKSIYQELIRLKIVSMEINKKCPLFLGCHVAERVLSHVFKEVQRMPNGNRGFDFICNKGHKIDSKSSCLRKNNIYQFAIDQNKISDYFLCIGFDNRENLNPQHIWLIKGDELLWNNKKLNDHETLIISNSSDKLSKFSKYELTDKLKKTIECCDMLKGIDDLK